LVPGGLAGRVGAGREKLLREGGGNARSEKAVADGLKWLALHQAKDGHWGLHNFNLHARTQPYPGGATMPCTCLPGTNRRNDVAATAFALLPFLAAGITHKPPARALKDDYHKGIGAGLRWLIARQDRTGYFGGDMYAHALATAALCEAYALSADRLLKASAQKGLDFIVRAQHAGGGWRYTPRTPGDTSVTGWQLAALKSGQLAGLKVPPGTLGKVKLFLDSVESTGKGGYSYLPGGGETYTMTSVGLLCRQSLGVDLRDPSLLAGVKRLKAMPPGRSGNLYYEYYATQVMHHMGGDAWQFWNLGPGGTGKGGIRDSLIARQDRGDTAGRPHQAGSWAQEGEVGGRLGTTALALLTLEVYYRHVPLHRKK
jgi:hypothetical protein